MIGVIIMQLLGDSINYDKSLLNSMIESLYTMIESMIESLSLEEISN